MKRGLLWGICAFNMVASGAAIFIVLRPYLHPVAHAPEFLPPPAQTASGDWKSDLEQATDIHQVHSALARVPNDESGKEWLRGRIVFGLGSDRLKTDALFTDRLLAQITRWGQFVNYGDENTPWLTAIVTDKTHPVLVRAVAMQAVADAALRHDRAEEPKAGDWRKTWRDFLSELLRDTTGTGLQGQALYLMDTSQHQKLTDWSAEEWNAMIGDILAATSSSDESSKIAALNVSPIRASSESAWSSVRQLAQTSGSETLQANAIAALGQRGYPEDIRWLNAYSAKSVKISQAIWAARAKLPPEQSTQ